MSARTSRRSFLRGTAMGMAAFGVPAFWEVRGAFAQELARTPRMTEGPFYPDRLPLDTDNDLIIINDAITPAVGEITHLTGRILDRSGSPVRNAVVEIWQCDANAVYLHTSDSGRRAAQRDVNFQGFGRFTTGSSGAYCFRTIKPVPYPGRPAPHIHVKVKRGRQELLTTQFFIAGHPNNMRDGIYAGIRSPLDRELLQVDFRPLPGSRTGEHIANFDVVLGRTLDETAFEPSSH
jgi:protocatechuate 3,4-dioxygenase beta subunit